MKDENKTKRQLIDELAESRQRISELEALEDERLRAPQDLLDSAQLLQTVLDHTHLLVAYMDPQFNFVRVNRAYAEADERDPSFFPGKNHFDLYPNAENESIFGGVVQTGEPHFASAKPFEYAEHPERGVSYWDWSLMPIKGSEGQVTGLVFTLLDVTERKRVEETLRESEEKFRSLAERSPNMIFINHKGRVVYANEKCEEVLGYKREEFYSPDFDFFSLIPPECIDAVKAAYGKHMKGEEVPPYEYALLAKHGERIEAINATRLTKYNGEDAILGVVTDITERKQAEERLRILSSVVEQSARTIAVLDKEGVVQYANPGLLSLYQISADEVVGKNWRSFMSEDSTLRDDFPEIRSTVLDGGMAWKGEVSDRSVGGELAWREATIFPIKDDAGEVAHVVYSSEDVTERKRAENLLRSEKERFQVLVEQSPLGVSIIRRDGRYSYINPKFVEIFGYTLEDIPTGEEWFRRAYPDEEYRSEVISAWQTDLTESKRGESRPRTFAVTCKDGSEKVIRFRPVTMENGDQFVIYEDVTERKRAEELARIQRDLGLALSAAPDLDETLRLCVDAAIRSSGMDCGGAYLVDETTGDLTLASHVELPDDFVKSGSHFAADSDNARLVIGGKPVYSRHQELGVPLDEARSREGLRAIAVIPVAYEGRVIACLNVASHTLDTVPGFGRAAMESISAQIGSAIVRSKAEEALRVSEVRFRSLVEQTTDGVYCYEYDPPIPTDLPVEEQVASLCRGILVECNDVCARSYGATRAQEVIGGKLTELFATSSGSLNDFFLAFVEKGCRAVDLELTDVLDDGTVRYYSNTGHGVVEDGMLLRIWGTFRDITERKRAEEALRESEERFKGIFENALVGQYRTTPDGRILMGNPALVRMLGYSSFEELAQRNLEEGGYEPEYPRSAFKERIESARQVDGLESAWVRRDGTPLFVRESARAIHDEAGNTLYYEGTVEDITDRKRAEEEIRRRNEELVALNAIAETVSQSLDLTDILEGALDKVLEIMRIEAGGIYLADEARQRVTLRAHRGVSEEFAREVGDLAIDEETVRRVDELGRAGKLILASKLLLRDRTLLKAVTTVIAREKLRSYVQVLIRVKGSPVGLLVVASRESRTFTREEEELLSTIANQIGVGIENARLYLAEKRRLSEMEALRQTTLDISKQLDLDAVLHSIASRAVELLGGTSGGLYLYRPEQDALEWAVAVGTGVAPIGSTLRRGHGLSGRVWETGQPLIVDDYSQWEGRAAIYEDYPLRAVVAVPVRFGEKFLGVLNVLKEVPEKFSPAEAELLSLLAHQAAIAIENARLYEAVQARTEYLETLQEINATLRSTSPLNEVLGIIVRRTTEALGYIGCTITLPDATGERLVLGAAWGGRLVDAALRLTGLKLESFGLPLKVKDNLIVRAFHTGEVQTSRGQPEGLAVGSEPSISPKIARAIERVTGAKSAACVPLRLAERTVGVLVVTSSREQLSDEERAMLLGLGDQAALAVENARLYEAVQARSMYLETLQQINATLRSTLPLNEVLETIVQGAAEALGYIGTLILLPDESRERLVLGAVWGGRFVDASVRFTGLRVGQFRLPLTVQENPMAEAFLTGELRILSGTPERIISGVEPPVSAGAASAIRRAMGAKGAACVPLRVGEKGVGALVVISPREGLADEERIVLLGLADQAALAIENARLYEETESRAEELAALYDVSLEVASQREVPALLQTVVHRAMGLLEGDGCGFYAYDEERQELEFIAAEGLARRRLGETLALGEGASGKTAQTGEPVLVIDYARWEGRSPQYADEPSANMLAVPVKTGDVLSGVLYVYDQDLERRFDEGDIRLATLFANHAAIAIENARLYEETGRRAGELAALYDVSLEVASQLEVPALLQTVVHRAMDLLEGDGGGFYLYDEERRDLELIAAEGTAGRRLGATLALGEGASGKAAQGGEPLVVMDYARWEGRSSQFADQPTRNLVTVPVKRADALLGVLYVYDLDLERRFDEGDIRLATLFANYAAVAIENARLYEETGRRAEELAALYDVSLEVASQLELPALLETVVERAMDLTGVQGGGLYLYDPDRQDLELITGRGVAEAYKGVRLALGEGASGKVAQSGEPMFVTDYANWEGASPQWGDAPDSNILAVPIKRGDALLGVLYVYGQHMERDFDESDLHLATLFGNQAAIAIENARLYEARERRSDELMALYETSLDITSRLDPDSLLKAIIGRAVKLLDGRSGDAYLYRPAEGDLASAASLGIPAELQGAVVKAGDGFAGRILVTGEPLVVEDYESWEGRSDQYAGYGFGRVLGAPIRYGTELLGVLVLERPLEKPEFKEADVDLLTLFANQAAIAIENARLYQERTRRAEELATLYDISLEVTGKTELSEVLPSLVQEAAQLLAADAGGMDLFDPQAQELELSVSFGYEKDYTGTRFALGEGLAGKVAQNKEPMIVDDYSAWEGRSPQWEGETLVAALAVPLLRGDDLLGVLSLGRRVPRPFDDNDLALATLFANQAAAAIEKGRLFDSVKSHQTDLQRLSAQLINSQEEERKRISQELHDEMGQALTAMSINLAAIEKELSLDRASAVGERLAETDGLIERTLDQMRDLALDLRPSMLDDLGLVPTLRWYIKRYAERLDVDVEFEAIDLEERLPAEMETVLYRTVQEALTNVARHAHAGRVDVRLQRGDSTVTVSIEDDGRGFDVEKVGERELQERGAGLLGMRERVASLGGSLSIESAEGQGTRLSIEIPLPRRAHDEQDKSASGRGSHHRS